MAGICYVSSHSPMIQKPSSLLKRRVGRLWMLAYGHASVEINTFPVLQIKSSIKNKVFEDRLNGIVCYRDENGEVTCEGYDEGPRLHRHQIPRFSCDEQTPPRSDYEIVDILQRSWHQMECGGVELDLAGDITIAAQNDFKCNGFNTLC